MDEELRYLTEHDIIDLPHIRQVIEMEKRKEILSRHPYPIWQGKNGKWYTYLDECGEKKLKKRTDRSSIEKAIVDHYRDIESGGTIADVFKEWNDWKSETGKIEKSTHLRNEQVFNRHYSVFGKRKLNSVKPEEFVDFLETQLTECKLTAKAFSSLKTVTKGFLKRAKKRRIIGWSVESMLEDLDVSEKDFRQVYKDDKKEVFNEEEMQRMIQYLVENIDEKNVAILLMFVTGMRIGEVVSLKPEDISEKSVFVHRTETCYRGTDGKFVYEVRDRPKTKAGFRNVVVPEKYEWLLRKAKMLNPFGEWTFELNGKRIKECQVERRLEVICDKLHIERKSPHKIRKTYVSILLDENVDARLVMDQVGHASISVSERNYHRNRKTIQKKQEILARIPEFDGVTKKVTKVSAKNVIIEPKTGTF